MTATLQEIVPTRQPPAPGQLVSVRNRRFVATAIAGSSIHEERSAAQNLVTLSSVEDDALGEELQVVWELEPGAAILERASMPELSGFDSPARLDAFLNAVRWGAISQADTSALQAPFRSGVDIEDYQLDPLSRAIQMCLQLLRAEVWVVAGSRKLHRITARVIPDNMAEVPVAIAHGRLVVLGGDNQRLHEELIFAGGGVPSFSAAIAF